TFIFNVSCTLYKRDYENRLYFTVKIPDSASSSFRVDFITNITEVTKLLKARYEGQVGELRQYHWISVPSWHSSSTPFKLTRRRITHEEVMQQFDNKIKLHKRNTLLTNNIELQPQIPERRLFKRIPELPLSPLLENVQEEHRLNSNIGKLKISLNIADPAFDRQWHLFNTEEFGYDMNVTGVWSQGITGENVIVAIVDDGLEMEHEDLRDNYFPEGSFDFNEHVKDPKPRLSDDTHGTRCAGEIAAAKNDICGLGIAYNAKVAGLRILSGDITQADEATAINYGYQQNHIYSCSWGPPDDGESTEGPKGIVLDAFKNGIQYGRNGLGSIFVFASGNGGSYGDNCNFDGYTNSIYTVTVGAIDKLGNHPSYAERCAAQLVVAYSSGSGRYIYTTDVGGERQCSDRHGGTSAAAPLAAGVFALVLSVRPDLSWRDIQHLCVQSAVPINLDDEDWAELPSGRMFNHKYGYGVLDAYRIVELAKHFKTVRPQVNVEVESSLDKQQEQAQKTYKSDVFVTQEMIDESGLSSLEHVTATVTMKHHRRGDFEILLSSPNGVVSQLGTPRPHDKSESGLKSWTFMTVKHWDENPIVGNWTLLIKDAVQEDVSLLNDDTVHWKLTLWGEIVDSYN
ncbi:peptidase S8/S53 domain-containing protein, partial [Mycotypha africana]|uniref:peptidase S8/S53 domain-containing protein n=1 Tax=Mycotypha africana TaxID=64632 RepID=UPI002301E7F2